MPFTYEEKCFVKIYRTICKVPNSLGLNPVNYVVYEEPYSRACIALNFQLGRSHRQSAHLHGRILTNRSSTKSIDHWLTNWKLWFDWMVDTLNSCFDYLVHLLPCSVMYSVAICVLRTFLRFDIAYWALRWYTVTKCRPRSTIWLMYISR